MENRIDLLFNKFEENNIDFEYEHTENIDKFYFSDFNDYNTSQIIFQNIYKEDFDNIEFDNTTQCVIIYSDKHAYNEALLEDYFLSLKDDLEYNNISEIDYKEKLEMLNENLNSNMSEDIVSEDIIEETYSDEELEKMINKTFNQQKVLNIYKRNKYGDKRLYAHTRCKDCGREKRVFLSNLIKDPDKYGSCICSKTNIESRLDNIKDLYSGGKTLSNNTSGYTGVSFVRNYKGKLYKKWRAYIDIDNKRYYLGDFTSKSKAIKARKAAATKGLKWYKLHKNEFMKNFRKKSKRYRTKKYGSK